MIIDAGHPMSHTRPLSHTDYTVAWICALPAELTAAICVLDEEHPALSQNPQDRNSYTLGRIGGHNVVLVCLPAGQLGTNSAATVATQLRYSFPDVRFGLMVGIGGGAPSERHDIRLGDVVVSIPGKSSTGVIQYDFGRTVAEGRFICDSILNAPPQILLSAVNTVRARHNIGDRHMDSILSQGKGLSLGPKYAYQGSENDMLFQADYDHVGVDEACIDCEMSLLVPRPVRESTMPTIHYGTIASGNQIMRHGKTRESCRKELDILCFEMEAAGLMNSFSCLVVRGICDYADSHKNKGWQEYAAITAAAYAKELLCAVVVDRPVDRHDCLADSGAQSEFLSQRSLVTRKACRSIY
jgi:nucleoside phosphorylase